MIDKIRPLKIERPSAGGTQDDPFPHEANPIEDYVSTKGIAFEDSDARVVDLDSSGNIQFQDAGQASPFPINRLVKDFGTPAHSLVASVEATANNTKTLVKTSNTDQIFTGTAAGQIIKLPDATTLDVGHKFEIWNISTQKVKVQNFIGTELAELNSNGRTTCILTSNSTSDGAWALTYTLDNGNVFGTQILLVTDEIETSNNSATVWATKLNLTTPANLPLGNYLLNFQFIWRSSSANREADFRFTLNDNTSSPLVAWSPSTGRTQDRQLLSGFRKIDNLSGVNSIKFEFKRIGSSTTIFVQQARMFLWRVE